MSSYLASGTSSVTPYREAPAGTLAQAQDTTERITEATRVIMNKQIFN